MENRVDDRGASLVEVLIALVIMGLSIAALVTGLATAARSSASHRDQADASTYLVAAAERVKAAAYSSACAATAYESAADAGIPATSNWLPRGGDLTAAVEYWSPTTKTFATSGCLDTPSASLTATSVVTSQGTTQLGISGTSETAWIGRQVRMLDGPAAGQARAVTSVGAGKVLTEIFGAPPVPGNSFVVEHRGFNRIQRITITVVGPGGGDDSTSVVKRYPS